VDSPPCSPPLPASCARLFFFDDDASEAHEEECQGLRAMVRCC
jgi:hypothetical protein